MFRPIVALVCLVTVLPAATFASVPTSITVQGKLTDAGGVPLSGSRNVVFKIFDAAVGGTEIWPGGAGEMQTITVATDGLWIGLVGAVNPLSDAVFSDTVRWLEIAVDGTVLPRARLVTGPYAHRVSTVDGASGGAITGSLSVGLNNAATGLETFVAGRANTASGDYSAVDGGIDNAATATYSVVGGGWKDTASGWASVVDGGEFNRAYGLWSTIGGGGSNQAVDQGTTIAGGGSNIAQGLNATIGGGATNITDGPFATIPGGENNAALGTHTTIGGGRGNLAYGQFATIGGGGGGLPQDSNSARGDYSAVVGGRRNHASGFESTIGGGTTNRADGSGSTVPGGSCNSSVGANSFAAGVGAKANHPGSFVWNSSSSCADSFASTAANQFLVRADGGVGIGTNNPGARLHVNGAEEGLRLQGPSSGAPNFAFATFFDVAGTRVGYVGDASAADNSVTVAAEVADVVLATPAGRVLTATSTGNVGIGNTNPINRLQVTSAVAGDGIRVDGTSPGFSLGAGGGAAFGEANAAGLWSSGAAPGDAVLRSNGTFALHLQSGFGAPNMTLASNGCVGIGFTGPTSKLSVNGDIWAQSGVSCLGGIFTYGDMAAQGNAWASNVYDQQTSCSVVWTACSDERLKRNIIPLENSVDDIRKLSAVRFDWRRDEFPEHQFPEGKQIGLIAQDVQKVAPEAVQENKDGYLSVDYSRLVPLLVGSIKEQQQMIEEQRERITKLEETIQRMQP
jgi:hypothetical protein